MQRMQVVYRQAVNGSKQHYAGKPPYCIFIDHGSSLLRDLPQKGLEYTDKVRSFIMKMGKNTFIPRKISSENLFSTSSPLKFNKSEVIRVKRVNSRVSNTIKEQPHCYKSNTVHFPEAAIF